MEPSINSRKSNYYQADAVPLIHATFGMGSGMIVESIRCNGTERRLKDCFIRDIPDGECNHNEDAGVRCCKTTLILRQLTD